MKHKLLPIMLALVLFVCPIVGMAQEETQTTAVLSSSENDFRFSNGTITKYIGNQSHVVIPETINGQAVTSIGDFAFTGQSCTSIVMPDSIIETGLQSFAANTSLVSITLSKNLKIIGDSAFSGCESLSAISIPSSVVTIKGGAFSSCTSLTSVTIPNSVTSLGSGAFMSCSALTSVQLSSSLEEISQITFSRCDSLASIVIPQGVRIMADGVFYRSGALQSISLPDTLVTMGSGVFDSCSSLRTINFAGSVSHRNRMFIDQNNKELYAATWNYGINDTTSTPTPRYDETYFASIINPSSVEIEDIPQMRVGDSITLSTTVLPVNATFKTIEWVNLTSEEGLEIQGNTIKATQAGNYHIRGFIYHTASELPILYITREVEVLPAADITPSTGTTNPNTSGNLGFIMPSLSSTTANGQLGAENNTFNRYDYDGKSVAKEANLVEASNGYLRVESIEKDSILVEEYNKEFQLVSTKNIPLELKTYVAFHEGAQYFYLMFSDSNPQENDEVEVARVVKYSKNWERISAASLYGANTVGGVSYADMIECDGNLLVHSRHTMYKSSDGLNHQANLRFTVDIASMAVLSSFGSVSSNRTGYVSHSFHQLVDASSDGFVVTADHGDAIPRAFVLFSWSENNISDGNASPQKVEILQFAGDDGVNATSAKMGGMEIGTSAVLMAGATVTQDDFFRLNMDYNVFLSSTPKDNFTEEATTIQWLTNYDGESFAANPHLVEISEDKFVLLWNEITRLGNMGYSTDRQNISLHWAIFDGSGKQIGATQSSPIGDLSEIAPIYTSEGNLVWYITGSYLRHEEDGKIYYQMIPSSPEFFTLNLNTATVSSSNDSPNNVNEPSSWAVSLIEEAKNKGLLEDMSDITSKYTTDITREEFCRLLMNVYESTGKIAPTGTNPFTDTSHGDVISAYLLGIVKGTSDNSFSPNNKITRQELAVMVQRTAEHFETITGLSATTSFNDHSTIDIWARESVFYAQREGFLVGSNGNIRPLDNLTCEEAIIVALRLTQKFE